jgi:hypothetical protein
MSNVSDTLVDKSVSTIFGGLVDLAKGLREQAELHRAAAAQRDQEADKIERSIAALEELRSNG